MLETLLTDIFGASESQSGQSGQSDQSVCPLDLRFGPTLSPMQAVSAARSFDDIDDVARAFGGIRAELGRGLSSCSVRPKAETRPQRRQQQQQQQQQQQLRVAGASQRQQQPQQFRAVPGADSSSSSSSSDPPLVIDCSRYTFAACLLRLADPTVPLLEPADADRCLAAFVSRAAATLDRDSRDVAAAFSAAHAGKRGSASAVVEHLRRPLLAVSDAGLSDAFVLSMSAALRIGIVVRRGDPGTPCETFPPDAAATSPCALVVWTPSGFAISDASASTLRGVQRRLARELLMVAPPAPTLASVSRMALGQLSDLAARLGVPVRATTPLAVGSSSSSSRSSSSSKTSCKTRAELVDEISQALRAAGPQQQTLSF